jgi:DNA-binding transcriptional LysR family regulator
MTGNPDWELYRSFLEVVRDGSLSGAARRHALTQPTIGRHIDALEKSLGLSLFTRSKRGLLPTSAALDLLPHVEAMASASAALLRTASGEATADRGTVRLTASEVMGCEILPPVLAEFRHKHPGITLELALTNRNEDLARRDADIAVRMVRPTQSTLVARKLGMFEIGLYAHKSYLRKFGTPHSIADLASHGMVGFDRDDHSFRSVGPEAHWIGRENFAFRCDSDIAQLASIAAGAGIGGCPKILAARRPQLVPVLADVIQFKLQVWLAMHEGLKATRSVRLLFDHLAIGLGGILRGNRKVPKT